MPLKIAMLLTNPFRPDPRVLKEAESLAALGHEVTVICWDRAAELQAEETLPSGARILRVQNVRSAYGVGPRQLLRLLRFWRAARRMLGHCRPDLVHCHDFDTLPAGLWWRGFRRRPVVYDAHEYYADMCKPQLRGVSGALLYHLIRLIERLAARMASAIVTVDENLGAIYRGLHRRVIIIGHYPRRALALNSAPVFTRGELTLLYVGRLSVDRGLLIYAELVRALRQQGLPARLRLAGAFNSSLEEAQFRQRCENLQHAVELIGWVPYRDVPALLREADVGLALLQPEPYYVAAIPVKLFEYMAAGLPVLISNFPAVAEIVKASDCGALLDPTDVAAAAERVRHWWEHREEARRLGENGRQAVLQKYNWEELMQRLAQVYEQLTKR